MIYFTADTHFGHDNITCRQFANVSENEVLDLLLRKPGFDIIK